MGRRISKEFLHPSILEGVNNKIGNLDSLETDAKGNMVQAINELVEKLDNSAEIENGKELIANAVGEPLTAEKSFDEMSNDINGLLSTFKTNMMNNGVTVESSDKFKSLIDKIATMVEEGEGKGIQFAEGNLYETTLSSYGTVKYSETFSTNLDFVPTLIFIGPVTVMGNSYDYSEQVNKLYISNLNRTYVRSTESHYVEIIDISENSFTINFWAENNSKNYGRVYLTNDTKYYAIGVGEEDTTLRDSLADILENKGVDVTEEDDMASLITKVDDDLNINYYKSGTFTDLNGTLEVSDLGFKPSFVKFNGTMAFTSSSGAPYNVNIFGVLFAINNEYKCFFNGTKNGMSSEYSTPNQLIGCSVTDNGFSITLISSAKSISSMNVIWEAY